jgi:hypothetical protein
MRALELIRAHLGILIRGIESGGVETGGSIISFPLGRKALYTHNTRTGPRLAIGLKLIIADFPPSLGGNVLSTFPLHLVYRSRVAVLCLVGKNPDIQPRAIRGITKRQPSLSIKKKSFEEFR